MGMPKTYSFPKWPFKILLEVYSKNDQLLCVLAGGRWVRKHHSIYIYWYGVFRSRFICLWQFNIPQKWWSWKVLTKSKKLFWYGKTKWGEL